MKISDFHNYSLQVLKKGMVIIMKYYVVDVFTDERFHGNPAGVCLVDKALDASIMQKIAFENNLAETAFLVKKDGYYDLRWFTPEVEIDLCGHATLGSAYVIMSYVEPEKNIVEFHTLSGVLTVTRIGELFTLNFPVRKPVPCETPNNLERALGVKVLETHMARDLLVLLEDENDLVNLKPDYSLLSKIDQVFGFIVTARGTEYDFVSRFFAPGAGIPEDPVTGSSHTTLIPFWSERLGKKEMVARQLSKRGGTLWCKKLQERVEISGTAVTYLIGDIIV